MQASGLSQLHFKGPGGLAMGVYSILQAGTSLALCCRLQHWGALQDVEDRVQRVICCVCMHGLYMKEPSEWHFSSGCRELGAVTPLRGAEGSGVVASLQSRAACLLRQRRTLDLTEWESVM